MVERGRAKATYKMAKGTVTFRRERGHPDRSEDVRERKGTEVKKGGWGQAKAFGLYCRGCEEPSKMLSKL